MDNFLSYPADTQARNIASLAEIDIIAVC